MTTDHFDDLARRVLIAPVLERLAPASTVVCTVDDDTVGPPPEVGALRVVACTGTSLGDALASAAPDVLWLRGRLTWHAVRVLAPIVVAHAARTDRPPVLIVEGAGPRAQGGVSAAFTSLARDLDGTARTTWLAPGRGVGVCVPAVRLDAVAEWFDQHAPTFDALNALHDRNVELDARSLALFELFDQSQHNATELVHSLRFRIGTRIVRLGRRVVRKERIFRAPVEILARKRELARRRAELVSEHASDHVAVAPGALGVTYIVPELRLSGGVLAVLGLVKELRRAGIDARVVALKDRRHEMFSWRLATRPKVFPNARALAAQMRQTDIVVATHWRTAAAARAVLDAGRARHTAYFVQDYEPWFATEDDAETRALVRSTYSLIPHRIVTSEWLRERIAEDGYEAHKITLGVDLEFLYPRPVARADRPIVLAMARPRTPRRGFATLAQALTRVHEAVPDAEIVLFGEDLVGRELSFPFRAEGVVTDRERLAQLYSAAHVFVDVSEFQAFGLPAIEAMACGTAPVITEVGGVHEYAVHEHNCLLVPPDDSAAAADAIIQLLTDDAVRARLRDGALATSACMSIADVAQRTREAFEKISSSTP